MAWRQAASAKDRSAGHSRCLGGSTLASKSRQIALACKGESSLAEWAVRIDSAGKFPRRIKHRTPSLFLHPRKRSWRLGHARRATPSGCFSYGGETESHSASGSAKRLEMPLLT